jgi:hypothetical protein
MSLEGALGALTLSACFAFGRLADAMGKAIGRRGGVSLIAAALLAGAAEVDDLAQASASIHFLLRNASIETTFAGSASRDRSAFFAAGSADLADAAAVAFVGAAGAPGSVLRAASRGAGAFAGSVAARGSSLKPKGTDGSLKPVMESNGIVSRSGLREKFRLTAKASFVTSRSLPRGPRTHAAE